MTTPNTPLAISGLDASGALQSTDIFPVVRPGGGTNTQKATLAQLTTLVGGSFLAVANDLSDLTSASTARTNLGLGTAAVEADTKYAHRANDLSDLDSASTARTNLGLGTAAVEDATSGTWTATVQGGGTAGTYEISSQISTYYRIGKMYFVSTRIELSGSITAGGSGNLQISGLPATKKASHAPRGVVSFKGVDLISTNEYSVCGFASDSSASAVVEFFEIQDNDATGTVPVSAVAANDHIIFSIAYEVA